MGRAVPSGSLVTVTTGPIPWLGLVALTYGETVVIHRVWRRRPLRTRGDAAPRWDPPGGVLLGVVSCVSPPGRPMVDPRPLRQRLVSGLWAAAARVRWALAGVRRGS